MNRIINSTKASYETCASLNGDASSQKYQLSFQTSDSLALNPLYHTILQTNIDIFTSAYESIDTVEDPSIKGQAIKVLQGIYKYLQMLSFNNDLTNYLSKLNLLEVQDSSALIEWNFQSFRVGFSIESNVDESSYYIVSEDRNTGIFMADTRKIGTNLEAVIKKVVKYVLENT